MATEYADPLEIEETVDDESLGADDESQLENDEPVVKRRLYSCEVRSMWNLIRVYSQLGTRDKCVAFAEENGLIPVTKLCRVHKKPMSISMNANHTVGAFVCYRGNCRKTEISRAKETWFDKVKLEMSLVYYLMYCFSRNWAYDDVQHEDFTREERCLSRATITDWYGRCREVVVAYQLQQQDCLNKLGDPEKFVQGEEGKSGKRDYKALVEHMWRSEIKKHKKDPFVELVKAIQHAYSP